MRASAAGWRVVLAAAWSVAAAMPALGQATPPDTIGQRLQACTACHGKEGVANGKDYFPRIAGKPAGYLYNQLRNFREGRRSNATMAYFVANMSDTYLAEIATYFASLDLPYATRVAAEVDRSALERGEALVQRGDAALKVPACVQCHGDVPTGTLPSVPGLVGLRKEYLLAQFGGWRTDQRRATEPDCMRSIGKALSMVDVAAVTDFLSQQPVPHPSTATQRPSVPLPLECGSTAR